MEDKYVMLVDENGQPYIAHSINLRQTVRNVGNSVRSAGSNAINAARTTASNARSGAGRGVRAVHKYIAKIGEGAQARYFYTQEELRAYQQQAARQAQGMANKAGQTMRNVGNKAGQVARNAVNTVKDKAGVDERQRAVAATNRLNAEWQKAGNNRTEAYNRAAEDAAKAVSEYQRTALGKAETAVNKVARPARIAANKVQRTMNNIDAAVTLRDKDGNEISAKEAGRLIGNAAGQAVKNAAKNVADSAKDKAGQVENAVKSKYDRMRDEFKDTADKAKDAGNKVADKVKDTFRKEPPKAELSPEGTERIIKEDIIPETIIREDKIHENKVKENITPEKKVVEKVVSEGKLREKSSPSNNKSKYGEYKDDDPDFSDENYEKAKNIGNTDFSSFKRSDGTSVILEEDMKWVLPKGVDANDPAIRKALSDFEDHVASARKLGEDYTGDQWRDAVTEAIDKASEEALKKQKK